MIWYCEETKKHCRMKMMSHHAPTQNPYRFPVFQCSPVFTALHRPLLFPVMLSSLHPNSKFTFMSSPDKAGSIIDSIASYLYSPWTCCPLSITGWPVWADAVASLASPDPGTASSSFPPVSVVHTGDVPPCPDPEINWIKTLLANTHWDFVVWIIWNQIFNKRMLQKNSNFNWLQILGT